MLAAPPLVHSHTAWASPIKHVVVIYLENHSFDNLLGFWCDMPDQVAVNRCPDGGMPSSVTLADGTTVTPSVDPDVVPQVSHETADQQNALANNWDLISGCQAAQNYACISGYQPSQIPNAISLAQDFAISDATFSMQDSPSWFGHLYAVAASTDGFTGNNPPTGANPGVGWGCDSGKTATWGPDLQSVPSCIPDPALQGPDGAPLPNGGASAPSPVPYVPTIMDRLSAAGLPWRIYGATCPSETVAPSGLETCTPGTTGAGDYLYSVCPSFAECLYSQDDGLVPGSQFTTDATSGNLPAFSLITPSTNAVSEHNGFSMTAGDNWLGSLVSAAMNGPEWDSTAVFITWDDCGCFYDQASPGTNPDGTQQGPRSPLIIVSPYARPGYTDTTPTTFAGILGYVEHTFRLAPLGANDAYAYNFCNAFNYQQAPLRPARMLTRPVPKGEHIDWAQANQDT